MAGTRQERVSEVLREEISALLSELKDPRVGFASITRVEMSSDLRHARVYVSVLGDEAQKKATMEGLRSATGFIRSEVGRRVRLFRTPEIAFHLDESLEKGARVLKLIEDVGRSRPGAGDGAGTRGESGIGACGGGDAGVGEEGHG
ncbi:MAG: 30S ribosome-binding factor RbfA [Bacillota bacterium]